LPVDPAKPIGWQRFQERGHHRASALRYAPELINEAVAALDMLFQPWLDAPETPQALGPWRLEGNELKHARAVGGDPQLLELLELVHYLKSLGSHVEKGVLDGLKADYPHTFLQLAFAHRFRVVGATDLVLEPPVSVGRGDIAFTFDGRPYVVECYVPDRPTRGGPEEELRLLLRSLLDLCKERRARLSIGIRLLVPLTVAGRRFVWSSVLRAMASGKPEFFRSRDLLMSVAPIALDSDDLPVHAEVATKPEPDIRGAANLAPKDRVFAHDWTGSDVIRASQIGIWRHETSRPEQVKAAAVGALGRLMKRAAKKLAQAKRADNARRVMIVQSWVAGSFSGLSTDEIAASAAASGMLGRSNVEGLLFVARHQGETRHRYGMHPISSTSEGSVLDVVARSEPTLHVPPLA
jgi:hypothetical protein